MLKKWRELDGGLRGGGFLPLRVPPDGSLCRWFGGGDGPDVVVVTVMVQLSC